jgi:hypothetical protein
VERSRIYVGIFGGRYGSGITEAEYRRARERDLPRLIYFKEDSTIPPEMRETDGAQLARLNALKEELRRSHTVSPFINPDNLASLVATDLHNWLFDKYLPPLLERAARGEGSRAEAQDLLGAIKGLSKLDRHLPSQLRRAGYNIAISGQDNIAIGGNENMAISGSVNSSNFAGREQQVTNIYNNATSPSMLGARPE